jgi:phosphate starvation-inducible protein PhoH and related proteins
MAKQSNAARKGRQFQSDQDTGIIPFERSKKRQGANLNAQPNDCKRFEALTEAQGQYYLTLKSKQVTFATGPAGTGKSHVAVARACELLNDKEIDRIVVTRPIQGVDDEMGFLPGTIEEKTAPYFAPIREIMEELMGYGRLEMLMKAQRVVFSPLQFIRGRTFHNSFMLLDEAQNTTPSQMQAFLTRIGRYSTVAVDGDIEQTDIKGRNGLEDAIHRFKDNEKFGFATFEVKDIVRSDVVRDILIGYRKKTDV